MELKTTIQSLTMKKFLVAALALILAMPALAEEYPISGEQLPEKALKTIASCWPDATVEKAFVEKRASLVQYNVELSGGVKMQFSKAGACTECVCKKKAVPELLIPSKIRTFIADQFPDNEVREIEHDSKLYKLVLDNKLELTFNSTYRLIDIDKP